MFSPRVFGDERGRFLETWRMDRYAEAGIAGTFVQDSLSESLRDTVRGLHFQHPKAQGKLISVAAGRVFDVVVDVRRDSPTFSRWVGVELSEQNARQIWIPPGFAHGFAVLSDRATVLYKCTAYYAPECERVIRWNDPSIAIAWPVANPTLSQRDAAAPLLNDIARAQLPTVDDAAG